MEETFEIKKHSVLLHIVIRKIMEFYIPFILEDLQQCKI
jgi:hypothetical protein